MIVNQKRTEKEINDNLELLVTYLASPTSARGHRAARRLIEAHEQEINYVLAYYSIFKAEKREIYRNEIIFYWFDKLHEFDLSKGRALHYYLRQGAVYAVLRCFRNEELWKKKEQLAFNYALNQIDEASNLDPLDEIESDSYLDKSRSRWNTLYSRLHSRGCIKKGSKLETFLIEMIGNPDPEKFWSQKKDSNNRQYGSIQAQLTKIQNSNPGIFDNLCLDLNPQHS